MSSECVAGTLLVFEIVMESRVGVFNGPPELSSVVKPETTNVTRNPVTILFNVTNSMQGCIQYQKELLLSFYKTYSFLTVVLL